MGTLAEYFKPAAYQLLFRILSFRDKKLKKIKRRLI